MLPTLKRPILLSVFGAGPTLLSLEAGDLLAKFSKNKNSSPSTNCRFQVRESWVSKLSSSQADSA